MKVRITPSARLALTAIHDYIAKDSPPDARKTLVKLGELIDQCGLQPYAGRMVPEYDDPLIRERIWKSYRIIYRLKTEVLEVITVFHTARLLH